MSRQTGNWIGVFALLVMCVAPAARGQERRDEFEKEFGRLVFAPELLMAHQDAIGLTEDQRAEFVVALQATQSDVVPMQLELVASMHRLTDQLAEDRVDKSGALANAERAMELEAQVKLRHLDLLIDIKNLLTDDQQQRLRELRERGR